MVRLKTRYILFELIYPPTEQDEIFNDSQSIMLQHHKASPQKINPKALTMELQKVIQRNFGDYGAGRAGMAVHVKYFSAATSTGILRCSRDDYPMAIAALTFLEKVDSTEGMIANVVKVSGTIKKLEQYAVRRNAKMMGNLKDSQPITMSDDEVDY